MMMMMIITMMIIYNNDKKNYNTTRSEKNPVTYNAYILMIYYIMRVYVYLYNTWHISPKDTTVDNVKCLPHACRFCGAYAYKIYK